MDNKINFIFGDCLDVMQTMDDNSIDSVVTDPPYGYKFMNRKWDYDVPSVEIWAEVFRVLKPGAHLLSFGGTRTQHRIAINIEDAGFEIRDTIAWVYDQGFPKSLDISKAIDKKKNAVRKVVGIRKGTGKQNPAWNGTAAGRKENSLHPEYDITAPNTDEAKQWDGWGTALKPAYEPIILARKPLDGTVVNNVLKYSVGGINIDACRVPGVLEGDPNRFSKAYSQGNGHDGWKRPAHDNYDPPIVRTEGRWPANFIHDGSDEVLDLFPDSKTNRVEKPDENPEIRGHKWETIQGNRGARGYDGEGSAARFFYCAKASRSERGEGNKHPTVKPLALMEYLVKLVTPVNGVVLDPFAGSCSTLIAANRLGFYSVGIEKDRDNYEIGKARIEI